MWYVVQTTDGMEPAAIEKCRNAVPATVAGGIFTPTYEYMRRYQGAWHIKVKPLFSGYVFMESDKPEELEACLEQIPGVVTPVQIGGGFHPIRQDEEDFLRAMLDDTHCIRYSLGYLVDGSLQVEKGPLCGKSALVTKIDRHRRIAECRIRLFGEDKKIEVGLEIPARLTAEEYRQRKETA